MKLVFTTDGVIIAEGVTVAEAVELARALSLPRDGLAPATNLAAITPDPGCQGRPGAEGVSSSCFPGEQKKPSHGRYVVGVMPDGSRLWKSSSEVLNFCMDNDTPEGVPLAEICNGTGTGMAATRARITRLVNDGLVYRVSRGRYCVSDDYNPARNDTGVPEQVSSQ